MSTTEVGRTDKVGQTDGPVVTPAQFSQAVGRTPRSITRYIQEGRIRATQTSMGWRIPASEIKRFLADPSFKVMRSNWVGQTDRQLETDRRTDGPTVFRTGSQTDERTSEQPVDMIPIGVFHRVFDRLEETESELRRSEQQRVAMTLSLQQHQRVLAEHAESLIEREARARQAEASALEMEAETERARLLALAAQEESERKAVELGAVRQALVLTEAAEVTERMRVAELERQLALQTLELQEERQKREAAETVSRRSWWHKIIGR